MQKVYLVLRNNRQSGPFTLDELVESGIKPQDLIWLEGKSTIWSYPSEISELKPYLGVQSTEIKEAWEKPSVAAINPAHTAYLPKENNTVPLGITNAKKVFVSLPKNTSITKPDQKPANNGTGSFTELAEELKKKVPTKEEPLPTTYQATPDPIEAKAEELKRKILSQSPEQTQVPASPVAVADPIEARAEELKRKILSQSREQTTAPANQIASPDPLEAKAEELKRKILSQTREQTPAPATLFATPDPIEAKAEELKRKILSQSREQNPAPASQTASPDPIEAKAEELKRKILSQSREAPAQATLFTTPDPIEAKAEELRRKILSQSSQQAPAPVSQTTTPDPIEAKAEELRRKILSQSSQQAPAPVSQTTTPDPIEAKAEELRRKILSQSSQQAPPVVSQTVTPDPKEAKAEELRRKILSQSSQQAPAAVSQTTTPDPIEAKAEELRRKILSQSSQQAPVSGNYIATPEQMEARAEELRRKILSQPREQTPPSGNYITTPEEAERRAEELRRKMQSRNRDDQFSNGSKILSTNPEEEKSEGRTNRVAAESKGIQKQPTTSDLLQVKMKAFAATIKTQLLSFSTFVKTAAAGNQSRSHNNETRSVKTVMVEANSSRSQSVPEEDFRPWTNNKAALKRKDIMRKVPAIAGAAFLLLAVGYLTSRFGSETPVVASGNTMEQIPFDTNGTGLLMEDPQDPPAQVPAEENISSTYPHPLEPLPEQKKEQKAEEPASKPVTENKVSAAQSKPEEVKPAENKAVEKKPAENKILEKKAVVTSPQRNTEVKIEPVTPQKKEEPVVRVVENSKEVAEAPKKKKSFTEKIDGFFGKLNKRIADEPLGKEQEPEQQPGSTTIDNAERKAVRRGEEAAPPKTANLREYIDVNTQEASGSWMMGVHGLKLVVHNRSNETVHQAAVEVRYFDEHQELIEKKLVNISNLAPKKSVTVSAPDHRLADHAEVVLVSVR